MHFLLAKIHLEKNGTSQEPRISELQRFYIYQTSLSDFLKLVATILLLSKIVKKTAKNNKMDVDKFKYRLKKTKKKGK